MKKLVYLIFGLIFLTTACQKDPVEPNPTPVNPPVEPPVDPPIIPWDSTYRFTVSVYDCHSAHTQRWKFLDVNSEVRDAGKDRNIFNATNVHIGDTLRFYYSFLYPGQIPYGSVKVSLTKYKGNEVVVTWNEWFTTSWSSGSGSHWVDQSYIVTQ